ncbi:MAG TPA: hypothetical protein VKY80_12655 [Croceibacterium sp.]|nr:hypothetical protein [Croceibacterium sp.]
MPRKLKVFRTAIGFHDAYVAAPSQKAALEAWGADANLFARGVAEQVTDPELMEEPLARPGEVIRRSRGDLATHLKALGPRKKRPSKAPAKAAASKKAAKPKPPPKRDKVDAAEAALRETRERQAKEIRALEAERAAVERRIEAARAKHGKQLERLERARNKAKEAYRQALAQWSDG